MADVEFEREESENQLIEKALKFLRSGCGCSRGAKGGPCSKLNSLKVLVFNKFPVESHEEKEKLLKYIKTKINARCRASKFNGVVKRDT